MKNNKLVKQGKLRVIYTDTETGEELKFQSKDFIPLMDERDDVREQIYKKICEETILQYKSDTLDIDQWKLILKLSVKMINIMDRTLYEMLYKS